METITGYEAAAHEGWGLPAVDDAPDLGPEVEFVMSDIARVEADIDAPDLYTARRAVETVGAALVNRSNALGYPLVARHPEFWPMWHGFVQRQVAINERRGEIVRNHRTNPVPPPSKPVLPLDELLNPGLKALPASALVRTGNGACYDAINGSSHGSSVSGAMVESCSAIVDTTSAGEITDTSFGLSEAAMPALLPEGSEPTSTMRAVNGVCRNGPVVENHSTLQPLVKDLPAGTGNVDGVTNAGDLTRNSSLSDLLEAYGTHRREIDGDDRVNDEVALPVQFVIDFLDDPTLSEVDPIAFSTVDAALVNVPNRTNIPKAHARSLYTRYEYARTNGWDGLKRMSRKRIRNSWHPGIHKLLDWAIKLQLMKGPRYEFSEVSPKNLRSRAVDAWSDEEVLKLFSLPLFTGCRSGAHHWTDGTCLVQNGTYWGYIITFMTGMRASEIGRLMVDSLIKKDERHYFDLRSIPQSEADEKNDEVALPDRATKTTAGERLVPVSQLLIDLGLLEHASKVRQAGHSRLFPDWHVYTRPDGRKMWGHHFSKSWNYARGRFKFTRRDLRLHGGRHTRAGWYDELNIPERIRDRLLGHAPEAVARSYGPTHLTPREADLVAGRTLPIEEQIAEILLTAKIRALYGELKEVSCV